MVSRETISLDTQIVVLQAPNGAGAFAEKQSFGFTTFLRFNNEFQGHAQWIRCFRVGISVVLNYRKIQFQSAMFSRSSRGISEDSCRNAPVSTLPVPTVSNDKRSRPTAERNVCLTFKFAFSLLSTFSADNSPTPQKAPEAATPAW
jgi:hypothetical protein